MLTHLLLNNIVEKTDKHLLSIFQSTSNKLITRLNSVLTKTIIMVV